MFGVVFIRVCKVFNINFHKKNPPRSSCLILANLALTVTGFARGAVEEVLPV